MDTYTIGLDYGTLSGRGILVRCRDGRVLAESVLAYPHGVMTETLPDGEGKLGKDWALEHPADYLAVLDAVIPELLRESGVDPHQIVGIGIDFTSCTMLPVDAACTPLCMKEEYRGRRNAYAKLWKHHGAAAQTERINRILKQTGLDQDVRFGGKCSSELMLPKIMEMLDEDPSLYAAVDEFLEGGDFLTRTLTGGSARSCSMAGYKLWWNREQGYPSESFFAQADERLKHLITQKIRGGICPMGGRAGGLCEAWAERLGLVPGTAVAPAIIDAHAGVPGSGVSSPSEMMLVIGTSSVLMALGTKPFSGRGVIGGVESGVVPGYYAYESGLACVGDLFDWYIHNMLPASLTEEARESGKDIFALLNEKAGKLRPGESGLLALDWWNGNKTPYVDSELMGCILGMTMRTRPEEIYRALIEATAFATRTIVDVYKEQGAEAREICASGGIAQKNPLLMQIYADVLGMPIKVAGAAQTAALGSAIYAALAAGENAGGYDRYADAVSHMAPGPVLTYVPDENAHRVYNELYRLFTLLGETLGGEGAVIPHSLQRLCSGAVTGEEQE